MTALVRCAMSVAASVLLIAAPGTAQGVRTDLLPPMGTVVRATLSSAGEEVTTEGVLTEATVEGLVLEAEEGRHVYHIPAERLLGLDASRGRNHWQGAALGFVIGALGAGLVFGGTMALAGEDGGADCWFCTPGARFLLGGAVGAAVGAPVGLIVGAAIGTAEWEPLWYVRPARPSRGG